MNKNYNQPKIIPGNKTQDFFSEIYLLYFERLYIYALRFFPEKEEAVEIVQDVMVKLWEKKENLDKIGSIEKYLYRSVYNECINKLEHMKVHKKYVDYKRVKLLEIELGTFEETFYQWEIREKLVNEIEKLTPQVKNVFEMRYFDGMKYKEIAEKLNVSIRTVESHLQNALKILKKKMKGFL